MFLFLVEVIPDGMKGLTLILLDCFSAFLFYFLFFHLSPLLPVLVIFFFPPNQRSIWGIFFFFTKVDTSGHNFSFFLIRKTDWPFYFNRFVFTFFLSSNIFAYICCRLLFSMHSNLRSSCGCISQNSVSWSRKYLLSFRKFIYRILACCPSGQCPITIALCK